MGNLKCVTRERGILHCRIYALGSPNTAGFLITGCLPVSTFLARVPLGLRWIATFSLTSENSTFEEPEPKLRLLLSFHSVTAASFFFL